MARPGRLLTQPIVYQALLNHGPMTSAEVQEVVSKQLSEVPDLQRTVTNALYNLKAKGKVKYTMATRQYQVAESVSATAPPPRPAGLAEPPPMERNNGRHHPSRIGNPPKPSENTPPGAAVRPQERRAADGHNRAADEPIATQAHREPEVEPNSPDATTHNGDHDDVSSIDVPTLQSHHEAAQESLKADPAMMPGRFHRYEPLPVVEPSQKDQPIFALHVSLELGPREIDALGAERVAKVMKAAALVAGLQADLEQWDPSAPPMRCIICGCTDLAPCDSGCEWIARNDDMGAGLCSACGKATAGQEEEAEA